MKYIKDRKEKVYKIIDGKEVWIKKEFCSNCKSEQEVYLQPSWLFHHIRYNKCDEILHSFYVTFMKSKMIYYTDGKSHFECDECGLISDGGTVCKHFPDECDIIVDVS